MNELTVVDAGAMAEVTRLEKVLFAALLSAERADVAAIKAAQACKELYAEAVDKDWPKEALRAWMAADEAAAQLRFEFEARERAAYVALGEVVNTHMAATGRPYNPNFEFEHHDLSCNVWHDPAKGAPCTCKERNL